MVQQTTSDIESIARFVRQNGLGIESGPGTAGSVRVWNELATLVMRAGLREDAERRQAHKDEVDELGLQREARILDEGQDDYVDINQATVDQLTRVDRVLNEHQGTAAKRDSGFHATGNCFLTLCEDLDVVTYSDVRSVSQLPDDDLKHLQKSEKAMIAYDYFGKDDPRNHVFAVRRSSKSGQVKFNALYPDAKDDCIHGVTSPQEFFNRGGWLSDVKFYASGAEDTLQDAAGFGGDLPSGYSRPAAGPPPPESVTNGGLTGGTANVTGGVVRPKRRNIKGRSDFMTSTESLRSYAVSGATMFNNMEEMYLNTISKEYAQEIIEELFSMWNLPQADPTVMKYAEDALWAFIIARTASNKADYKFQIDVPTKSGPVEIDFDVFSRLLAQKYGISRRNFARGIADNLRNYLRRDENQHLKSLSAQRIGADPQMGDMCFDGSTGCTSLTSSEASFARLLEARNLYERDDVIAEGASDKLMQGMSGGVRSIVPR